MKDKRRGASPVKAAVELKKSSSFTSDPRNANRGTKRGAEMIEKSIRDYGAGRSILIDRNGVVIAGNKSLDASRAIGMEDVLVVQSDGKRLIAVQRTDLDLSKDKEAQALAIADNRASEVGLDWSLDTLKALEDEGIDLAQFWDAAELEKIWPTNNELQGDEDSAPAVPENPVSKLGDLWVLGSHRILCGDSTNREDVERLMDGKKAVLFATDPPYGVAYGDETGDKASKFGKIANDENNGVKLQAFLEKAFHAWLPSLEENAAWYLWHAQMTQGFFAAAAAAAAAAVLIHRQIIWVKPSLVLGHGDFHWRHELCFYGWREGHRARWLGDRKQTTVWEIGRENQHIHPTQKPVEIFTRPMGYHTLPHQIVAEPFAGSGSQIIAAEKVGRRCFAMECSPAYVDVCVQRWMDATGKVATLEDGKLWTKVKASRAASARKTAPPAKKETALAPA